MTSRLIPRPIPRLAPRLTLMLLSAAIGAGTIRLFYAASVYSADFDVYWKAAHAWVSGSISPYAYTAADDGFIFKYPPFFLPLFSGFAFLGNSISRLLWAAAEICCIA